MSDGYRVHTIVFVDVFVRVCSNFLCLERGKGEKCTQKEGVKGASPTREVQLLIKKEVKVKEKG